MILQPGEAAQVSEAVCRHSRTVRKCIRTGTVATADRLPCEMLYDAFTNIWSFARICSTARAINILNDVINSDFISQTRLNELGLLFSLSTSVAMAIYCCLVIFIACERSRLLICDYHVSCVFLVSHFESVKGFILVPLPLLVRLGSREKGVSPKIQAMYISR